MKSIVVSILLSIISVLSLSAAQVRVDACGTAPATVADTVAVDRGAAEADAADAEAEKEPKKKRRGFWRQLFHGNEDHTFDKKFDVSFIASPSYTREASFGIGGLASGLYRLDRTDSLMQPSDVSIVGNVALSGLYVVGVNGNNYFKGNRSRLAYDITFANKPLDFWGIDYDACVDNPAIDYTRSKISSICNIFIRYSTSSRWAPEPTFRTRRSPPSRTKVIFRGRNAPTLSRAWESRCNTTPATSYPIRNEAFTSWPT